MGTFSYTRNDDASDMNLNDNSKQRRKPAHLLAPAGVAQT
jgi:hypothetical protein